MQIAKWMIAMVAVFNFGGLVADALVPVTARQHLWNPRWLPHAKFHNGQTMLMGIVSGSISLAILFGSRPLTFSLLLIASAVAANYFFAMVLAPAFPGTDWIDPEFVAETGRPLGLAPQQLVSYVVAMSWFLQSVSPSSHGNHSQPGAHLERSRLLQQALTVPSSRAVVS